MTHDELSKNLAKGLGIHWHEGNGFKSFDGDISFEETCTCGYHTPHDVNMQKHIKESNPTFSCACEVLRVMKEKLSEEEFYPYIELKEEE